MLILHYNSFVSLYLTEIYAILFPPSQISFFITCGFLFLWFLTLVPSGYLEFNELMPAQVLMLMFSTLQSSGVTRSFRYNCPLCHRGFHQIHHYKGHLARVHNETSLMQPCHICHKVFSRSDHLKKHVKQVHREPSVSPAARSFSTGAPSILSQPSLSPLTAGETLLTAGETLLSAVVDRDIVNSVLSAAAASVRESEHNAAQNNNNKTETSTS